MEDSLERFHWADYFVFVLVLGISMSTGIYFGIVRKQKRSTEEFLMASRDMNFLPVSFSLFVSWMSANSFLADPIECYSYGFVYIVMVAGYLIAIPPLAIWFAPYFNRLHIISAYEFLEVRYNKAARRLASLTMAMMNILWLGIATYAPALALSQVSGIPLLWSILLIGFVCTFYTALGGMKAVLWADTIQFFIMLAGQLAIVIRGIMVIGGTKELIRIASEGGRMNMFDEMGNFSPMLRTSFWTYLLGGITRVFVPYVSYQMLIQRYCTVQGPKEASAMTWLNMPMYAVMSTLIALNGLVLYGMYHDCDPMLSGRVKSRDQMVPLLVVELLGFLPGIPGLFMGTIFCASLSSMSSGMNGLSANLLRDFVEPIYENCKGVPIPENISTILATVFALFFGLVITLVAFLPEVMGSSVFALTHLTIGCLAGPVGGAFTLAIIMPGIKTLPVAIGFLVSLAMNMWIGIGGLVVPSHGDQGKLPMSTAGCPSVLNNTLEEPLGPGHMFNVTPTEPSHTFNITDIYDWHPLSFYISGIVITMILAPAIHGLMLLCHKIRRKEDEFPGAKYDEVTTEPEVKFQNGDTIAVCAV